MIRKMRGVEALECRLVLAISFVDTGQTLGDLPVVSVALSDLDGDGDLDAFFGNEGANKILLNDGKGTFRDSGQSLGDSPRSHVALGDLDGDGDTNGTSLRLKHSVGGA